MGVSETHAESLNPKRSFENKGNQVGTKQMFKTGNQGRPCLQNTNESFKRLILCRARATCRSRDLEIES